MCGRFTLIANPANLANHFSMPELLSFDVNEARYNIAPGQQVPIIHLENNSLRLTQMWWGLRSSWNNLHSNVRPINARLETLASKPMFKKLLNRKRCLIPVSGFYEWASNTAPKQPHYFCIPYQPLFAFTGLWDQTASAGGPLSYSFTIITTPASSEVVSVHHRMPFILDPKYYHEWLQNPYFTLINKQLQVPLHSHPVSTAVNSAKYDDSSLINYSC